MSNLNKSVLKKIWVIHKDEVQGLYITHNMFVSRSSRYDRFVNCIINKVDPNMINIPRKPQYRTLAYTKLAKSPNILFDGKNPLKMDELANVKFTSDDEWRKLVTNQNEIVKAWINNYNSNTPRKVKSVKFDDIKVNLVDLLNSSKNLSWKYKHTKQTLLALENYVKQNPEVIDIEDSESALLNSNNVFLNSIENEDIDHKPNQINEPLEELNDFHIENIHQDASQNDRLNQIDEPLEEV